MKTITFSLFISIFLINSAYAGCGIELTSPTIVEGNYTYDSLTNTYYIQPGDTLHYRHGMHYTGGVAVNWCLLNDSDYAQSNYVDITLPGTYKFYSECFSGSGTNGMFLGSINVVYVMPSAIEDIITKETCSAFYNASNQNITINYSNMYRQRITYSLYNLSGQQILHGGFTPTTGTDQQYNIDLSGKLSGDGMCIMIMETLDNRYTSKMVYSQ